MATEIISTEVTDREEALAIGEETLEVETRRYEISAEMHGWRVDRALAALTPEFSRSYLQQLMADGAVLWRGERTGKASAKVKVGDALSVELRPTQQAMAFVPQPMALDVVFEDAHLMVIVKPAGLVVHPAAGHWSGTLLNGLLAHHAGAAALPRAGIVHRLDKDTSGLMLVGKSRQAVEALVRAIAARDVQRHYLALAHGRWKGAVEQGVDLRGVSMIAFGGAGPVHACGVAELLESDRVIFPVNASVLSAFGTLVPPVRIDLARSMPRRLSAIDPAERDALLDDLPPSARARLAPLQPSV